MLVIQETVEFEYRNVTIYIHLDYKKATASFVEKDGSKKNWKFTDRTREYLGGWWLILEAMQEATKFADEKLKEQADLRDSIKEKKVLDMMIALSDLDKKGKK